MISVRDLVYRYPKAKEPTLRGLNLTLDGGEFALLCGTSGCGKSTLLHCLKGLIPDLYGGSLDGHIEVAGGDIGSLSVAEAAGRVGLVMQDPETQLCNLVARDEVAFGVENLCLPKELCVERVTQALEQVALTDLADEQVGRLSGGEKQRLAIASVLAMDAPVILLDEPAANLDPSGAAEIIQLLSVLRRVGKTVLLVQHELDWAIDLVDKLLVMEEGVIAAAESPRKLLGFSVPTLSRRFGIGLPQVVDVAHRCREAVALETVPLNAGEFAEWAAWPVARFPNGDTTCAETDHSKGSGLIYADGVSYSYPHATRVALRNVSLEVSRGEVVAVVGRNGSGKSTLARTLVGLIAPTSGSIAFDGTDLRSFSLHELFRRTGYVFQYPEHQFVTHNVHSEIAYGLELQERPRDEVDGLVEETLESLNLAGFDDRHPLSLSGGEKRRLSVATMMVLEPELLILDEPTYGLDETNLENLVGFLFQKLRERGITIVFITHDMRLVAQHASRVVAMSSGTLLFDGTPSDFFDDLKLMDRTGIIPPPVVDIVYLLRRRGWSVPRGLITPQRLAGWIQTGAGVHEQEGSLS